MIDINKIIIAFLFLFLTQCTTLPDFSRVVRGNTKRNPQNYDLENKKDYRHYQYLKKVNQKETDKDIIKRMNEEDKKKKK
jgi:hypothetical protein